MLYRFILSFILLVMLGCGASKHLDKRSLLDLPQEPTAKYGFLVINTTNLDSNLVDQKFDKFNECTMRVKGVKLHPIVLEDYRFVIVSYKWKCEYHGTGCNGEFQNPPPVIYMRASYLKNRGILEHELSHVAGYLNSMDNATEGNDEVVRKCAKI